MSFIQKITGKVLKSDVSKPRALFLFSLICLLLCAVIVLGCVVMTQNKTIYIEKKEIEETVKSGERIFVNNNHLGQTWVAAIEGLPKNTYNADGFSSDDTFKYYKENGKVKSYCGVDVSRYQGDIDWGALKSQGVDFAMLRVGGRGYSEDGSLYEDEMFEKNAEAAKKAGINVGVYFFSQAVNEQEGIEEADFVLNKISKFKISYPVVFDWEVIGTESARSDAATVDGLTSAAKAFCDKVSSKGYTPMIYSNENCFYFKYDLSKLKGIDLWLVDYDSDIPDFYYNYTMWQYSYTGTLDGIDGDVDLNISFKDYSKG